MRLVPAQDEGSLRTGRTAVRISRLPGLQDREQQALWEPAGWPKVAFQGWAGTPCLGPPVNPVAAGGHGDIRREGSG